MSKSKSTARRWAGPTGLVAAGLVAGGVLAGSLSANAATSTPTPSAPQSGSAHSTAPQRDESRSMRSDEHLLTGTTAGKVRAAAVAKYPTATVLRVETDSDGVYEAHLRTTAGAEVIVGVGKDFTVTGVQQGMGGHRGGPQGSAPSGSASSSATPSA